ncbi:DUF6597 domain-containing transcriptional factor [Paenibacillus sp. GCM10023252]|uniref:AraC family transcriptional regulator n=1 Tax=Paenibacillus sp. GCM10023252 TaxID=3252649 RepID=UPI003608CEB7
MLVRTYCPPLPLADYVTYFWYMRGYAPSHHKELSIPDGGAVDLVFDLKEPTIRLWDADNKPHHLSHSILCGPHTRHFVIDTLSQSPTCAPSEVAGIRFKPGGARAFLGATSLALRDQLLSLDGLWGSEAGELREELRLSDTPEEKFLAMERRLLARHGQWLLKQRRGDNHGAAVSHALERLKRDSVGVVVDGVGMSHRRFNEIFQGEVGLSPKRYARMIRFQQALHLLGSGMEVDWTGLAIDCGYYDQAHFIKEFRSFSGLSPTSYTPIAGRHSNHTPVRA